MSIESTLEYINRADWHGSKPGLERTEKLLAALGNPQDKLKFVHIAGTNGKGSTAAMIDSVLRDAGYRTGLYTSPYINRFNERMRVNGVDITDEDLERLTDMIRPIADDMLDDTPTEFEVITALAMQYFYEQNTDIVVLEVGLGGRMDSTNIINTPEAAVIAAIGLDHTDVLGDTVEKIAAEKAGIIKQNTRVISYPEKQSVIEVIQNVCDATNSMLTVVSENDVAVKHCDLTGCIFDYDGFSDIFVPLCGVYQPYNAAVAISTCRSLKEKGWKISDSNIINGIKSVSWPGRFEVIRNKPPVILDGSHNPHGINATIKTLKELFGDQKIIFVVGVMADKDVNGIFESLVPFAKEFHAVTPHNSRSLAAHDLAILLEGLGSKAYCYDLIEDGVKNALANAGEEFPVVALGSLYFSNDIRTAMLKYL